MWHKAIEGDLKAIFDVKEILFCVVSLEKERDVLFANVESAGSKQNKDIDKHGKCGEDKNKDAVKDKEKEKEKITKPAKPEKEHYDDVFVLFCDIEKSTNISNKQGKEMARVYGKISITDNANKNIGGFLSKKIQLADAKLTQKFVFSRQESSSTMGTCKEGFKVYSVNFTYFYKNKPKKTTEKFAKEDPITINISCKKDENADENTNK